MPEIASNTQEQAILSSWRINAAAWAEAIASGSIESRRLVTDAAMLNVVSECCERSKPGARILDVGCGEGWLAHALAQRGFVVFGIDAVPALIASARNGVGRGLGSGRPQFDECSYQDLAAGRYPRRHFDVAVCNFSLLGEASVQAVLAALPRYLVSAGRLIIQTVHPVAACGDQPYADGWRAGSWAGFDAAFRDPAPWYFRTLESWFELLRGTGFEVIECREPTLPSAPRPSSIIFVNEVRNQ